MNTICKTKFIAIILDVNAKNSVGGISMIINARGIGTTIGQCISFFFKLPKNSKRTNKIWLEMSTTDDKEVKRIGFELDHEIYEQYLR